MPVWQRCEGIARGGAISPSRLRLPPPLSLVQLARTHTGLLTREREREGGGKRQQPRPAVVILSSPHPSNPTTHPSRSLQPDPLDAVDLQAWYMDDDTVTDQRAPHIKEGAPPVTPATLRALGVLAWKVPPATPAGAARLAAIRKARGYSYQDKIEVSPAALPGYDQKIKAFYEEHVHTDEEIRYVLAGSGYFDVRGAGDEWIRILVKEGDLIVLPEGIYHRFTLDTDNHIVVNRLFVGEPVWTAHNRPQEEGAARESRARYVAAFLGGVTV